MERFSLAGRRGRPIWWGDGAGEWWHEHGNGQAMWAFACDCEKCEEAGAQFMAAEARVQLGVATSQLPVSLSHALWVFTLILLGGWSTQAWSVPERCRFMSCLIRLASLCFQHAQPHSAPFRMGCPSRWV